MIQHPSMRLGRSRIGGASAVSVLQAKASGQLDDDEAFVFDSPINEFERVVLVAARISNTSLSLDTPSGFSVAYGSGNGAVSPHYIFTKVAGSSESGSYLIGGSDATINRYSCVGLVLSPCTVGNGAAGNTVAPGADDQIPSAGSEIDVLAGSLVIAAGVMGTSLLTSSGGANTWSNGFADELHAAPSTNNHLCVRRSYSADASAQSTLRTWVISRNNHRWVIAEFRP